MPNPFVLQATAAGASRFGVAVAIDGGTLVVVQRGTDMDCGSAVVFERTGTQWVETQTLSTSDCEYNFPLFVDVAIEGDTIAAHSWERVYTYQRAAGSWSGPELVPMVSESTVASVSLAGGRLAVGLPDHAQDGAIVGAVQLYEREGAQWVQRQMLLGPSDDQGFGSSVRIDVDRLIVGSATSIGVLTPGRGSARVFALGGDGRFSEELELGSFVPDHDSTFGNAVAIRGDHALVADVEGGPGGTGAVYLFAHGMSGWKLAQRLEPMLGTGRFGESVALSVDRALVGDPAAPYEAAPEPPIEHAGTAHVFERGAESWSAAEPLWAELPMQSDRQGQRVALSAEHVVIAGVNTGDGVATRRHFGTVRVLWLGR